MKYLLFLLLFSACGSNPSNSSDPCRTTITFNNQTIQLVNGTCNMSTSPTTLPNSLHAETVTMCGINAGVLYNSQLYNSATTSSTSPTGYQLYADTYYVFPSNSNTQCWFKLSNGGQIDKTAIPPTF